MAGADRLVTGGRAPEIAPPHHGGADKTADHPQFTVHWHSDRAILLHLPCQPVSNGCDSLVGFRFPILGRVADTYCVVVDAGWNRRDRPLALPVAGRGRDFARECDRDGAGRHHWIPTASGQPHGTLPHFRGRFYGFGNTTYSFFVVHTLIFAAAAAAPAARLGRKFLSYLIVTGIGLVALVIDVAPTWGADIGGGLALIPAFAFLAMVLNRARFTLMRVLVIGAGTVVVVLGIAFADWLRPAASRSHAGQFFEQLITGDAWQIIWRKAQYAFNTLDTGLASRLTLVLLVFTVLALIKPERFAPAPLRDALADYATLRVALGSVLIGLIAGAALNDYGLRIVSLGFATAAPLLALMTVRGALPRAGAPKRAPASSLPQR